MKGGVRLNQAGTFFVLTGGPGSGKSTVIQALHEAGYSTIGEAGRAIIQEQVAIGGRALPWVDPYLFAELMLSWDIRSYRVAEQASRPVFFDRGVVDVLGYLRLMNRPVPAHMENAVHKFRYNPLVFIAPPWQEIFQPDGERKQDFQEAVRTYETMLTAYAESGYELVELPRRSVEMRIRFVMETLGNRISA
jgi:predicted ATPase